MADKTEVINLRVDKTLLRRAHRKAKKEHKTLSQAVREWLYRWTDDKPKDEDEKKPAE
jgi:antitoxin component of RelBE/YafQ-DinJ toxin-antitoxin module